MFHIIESLSKWTAGAAALAVALGLTAAPALAQADSRPDIVVAVNKLPRSLEPAERMGNVDVRVHYSVFDTLLRRDFLNPNPDGTPRLIPGLAESWKRIDPRTVEVRLRAGVRFHNGDTLSADDVLFTFSKARLWGKKAVLKRGRRYFGHLDRVEKIDDRTVRFVTKYPDVMFEQRLATYASWVINARSWLKYKKGKGTKWLKTAAKANRWNPVGTGPLKFRGWKQNDYVAFDANDDYFLGKPAFKSLTFKAVPEMAARIAGLVSGEFQIIVDVAPDQIPVLEKYKDIDARSVVLENSHVLVFNTKAPALKSKKLRQALSLAIDRAALRKSLWQGRNYTPNGHQLKTYGPLYDARRKGYVYDPEKARQLVKDSGYDGRTISYRLIPNYYLNGVEAAQIIQEMWRKVGVNVALKMADSFKRVRAKGAEIYAWSNTYRLPDPTGAIHILWGPKSAIQKKYKFWTPPPEFNRAAETVLTSADTRVRQKAFWKMLDIFEDEMPMTILYNPLYTYGVRSNIVFTPYPILYMDFRPDVFKIR